MKFEWDEEKNIANHSKHKVWFEEAQTVWVDDLSAEFYDPDHSDNEDRFIRIGHSTNERLLLVIFCERESGKIVRIISARKATKKERTIMKKEYNLNKLKKRETKSDKGAAKVPISLRLDGSVLAELRDEAERLGLPYQTFISSILYQYANGELVSKKTVDILKDFRAS